MTWSSAIRAARRSSSDWRGKRETGHGLALRAKRRRTRTRCCSPYTGRLDDVLKKAGDLSGKVVVSCSLPMNADDTGLVIAHTSSGAEELAKKVPKAQVVSAFGTVPSEALFAGFAARRQARRPSLVDHGGDACG